MKAALDYARARLDGLGLAEWTDALNFENIPRGALDSAYHLEVASVAATSEHVDNVHISVALNVRLFHSGFVDTGQGRDDALLRGEAVIDSFIAAQNRLTFAGIKTVQFDNLELSASAASNDNVFIVRLSFNILVVKSTR